MVSADLSYLITFASWSILPNIATQLLLNFLYSQNLLSKPSNQRTATFHSTYARTFVIVAYFSYQLYNEIKSLGPNYFQILNLNLDLTDEDAVKKSFRSLARQFHPDKVGPSLENEARFIRFRKASDVLGDPITRFAYERFGPSVSDWKKVVTLREYMSQGLTDWATQHFFTSLVHFVIIWFNGNLKWSFWRDATYITIMTIELYILTLPYRPIFLSILLPNFTPYEITHLISKLYISALPAFNLLLQCFQSIGQLSRAGHQQQQQQQDQTNIIPQDELTKLQEAQLVIQAMEQKIDRIHKLALDVKEESRRSLKNDIDIFKLSNSTKTSNSNHEKDEWTKNVSSELLRQFLAEHPIVKAQLNKASLTTNAANETQEENKTTSNVLIEKVGSEPGVGIAEPEAKEVLMESEKKEEVTNVRARVPFNGETES